MMRSPQALAIAVRRPDGSIILKDEPYHLPGGDLPAPEAPLLRGPLMLIEAMVTGVKALTFSAQAALQRRRREQPLGWGSITLTLGGAFLLAFLFFGFLPHWLSGLVGRLSGHPLTPADLSFHVVDGIIKTPLSCCISGESPCFPISAGSSNITARNTSPSAPSRPGSPWKWSYARQHPTGPRPLRHLLHPGGAPGEHLHLRHFLPAVSQPDPHAAWPTTFSRCWSRWA